MRFKEIQGLEEIKDKLKEIIAAGKVAHAQLFAGAEGSANLALALAYATTLNCTNRVDDDACGECASCRKIGKLIHPDVHFIFPVSPAKNMTGKKVVSDSFISIWREFVIENPHAGPLEWSTAFGGENKQLNISREESRNIVKKLTLKSFEGEYKVMIIWLPEYMHASAANALLKLLEEPPEKTVFLLVSNDHEKIIGTILSRVQMLKVRSYTRQEISTYISTHTEASTARIEEIARIADGDLNRAINLVFDIEDNTNVLFQNWMRSCFKRNYLSLIEFAENFGKANKVYQKGIMQYGLSILREALVANHNADELVHAGAEEREFVQNFSKTLSLYKIGKIYELLNTASYHLERNGNPKIIFMDTSLQITSTFRS